MVGPALLVRPVTDAGVRQTSLYLPGKSQAWCANFFWNLILVFRNFENSTQYFFLHFELVFNYKYFFLFFTPNIFVILIPFLSTFI